ncbi:MFS transporter [Candidatus Bathyarchaeota archaeon]|nr:MFS transporter [Candidatus Bathyarchaeota archaeon]
MNPDPASDIPGEDEIYFKGTRLEFQENKLDSFSPMILVIALMTLGAQMFGYMEAELLNTYIDHVLNRDPIFIAIMVSSSAIMGLIFLFVFGIFSDNTRSRFGRRRPYLLFGGLVAGISMMFFAVSNNYWICFIIDVVLIGIASNSFYAAQRVLVPDLVELKYRGRVNGILSIMSVIGLILPVGLTLLANEFFTIPNPDPMETGSILTQQGHVVLLVIGGSFMAACGVIGFAFLKDSVPASKLPPRKTFQEEIQATFNWEELRKQKDFFKLIIANTIYMSGVNAVLSYLFNFIFSLGAETNELIVMLLIAAPVLIITMVMLGFLTDRIGRKQIIAPTILLSCVGFILVPFVVGDGKMNVVGFGFVLSLILIGIIGVLIPINTWSQDLLPDEKRGQFFGIFNIVNTVSQVIGSMSAGLVATLLKDVVANPYAWIFAIVPIFFIISIPIFASVKETLEDAATARDENQPD